MPRHRPEAYLHIGIDWICILRACCETDRRKPGSRNALAKLITHNEWRSESRVRLSITATSLRNIGLSVTIGCWFQLAELYSTMCFYYLIYTITNKWKNYRYKRIDSYSLVLQAAGYLIIRRLDHRLLARRLATLETHRPSAQKY